MSTYYFDSFVNQDLALFDKEFLAALCEQQHRELFARISSLDMDENPIERIEGKISGGSINVDGTSSVRRTCNLTMVCDQIEINDFYWGIKTKFRLEVGIRNNLDGEFAAGGTYPEIVWFPQGVYLITSFNTSLSMNNCTISLSGKDKMCLLNGELGGQLFASIDFGAEETEVKVMKKADIGQIKTSDILIENKYYFKVTSNFPSVIEATDQKYTFIQTKEVFTNENANELADIYYRGNDNKFYYKTPKVNTQAYCLYQAVQNPEDLFEIASISEGDWGNNDYYYKKNDNAESKYYVLDPARTQNSNRTYFSLKELFTIDYEYSIKKITLDKIIREAVHAYAKEPYHNIFINDLSRYGLEQLVYRGDEHLIAVYNKNGDISNLGFLKNLKVNDIANFEFDVQNNIISSGDNPNKTIIKLRPLSALDSNDNDVTKIKKENKTYKIIQENETVDDYYTFGVFYYGQDIGYRLTDLTYPGDLISSIGDTLTSVLDKIKTMLGDFEYFYDSEGHFVFQRKRIYINTSWSKLVNSGDETYVDYVNSDKKKIAFNFEGNRIVSAIQNAPVLANVRNDFVVWGKRKSISGADIPIHARFAIDKKPVYYKTLSGEILTSETVDWRELIYRMALDYFAAQGCSEENPVVLDNNPNTLMTDPDAFLYQVALRNKNYYPTGITGYEQYYTDMQGFWRELYNPNKPKSKIYELGNYVDSWTKISDNNSKSYYVREKTWNETTETEEENYDEDGWSKIISSDPESLNFWIEFLDDGVELQQFSVPLIGDRTKVVNEDKASAIIFREVPEVVLADREADRNALKEKDSNNAQNIKEKFDATTGYTWVNIPKGFSQYLTISSRNLSIKNKIDELLYQYGYCIENISLTTLPVYFLQPNELIYVSDPTVQINGEYVINKLTIPLAYNGTMSISASKVPERLY